MGITIIHLTLTMEFNHRKLVFNLHKLVFFSSIISLWKNLLDSGQWWLVLPRRTSTLAAQRFLLSGATRVFLPAAGALKRVYEAVMVGRCLHGPKTEKNLPCAACGTSTLYFDFAGSRKKTFKKRDKIQLLSSWPSQDWLFFPTPVDLKVQSENICSMERNVVRNRL